jgi:hypothetical protein
MKVAERGRNVEEMKEVNEKRDNIEISYNLNKSKFGILK